MEHFSPLKSPRYLFCILISWMICQPAIAQSLDLGFSGLADRKVVHQLKSNIQSLPGHQRSRISLTQGHVWANFLPGTAPDLAEFSAVFRSRGLELQCYLDQENSSLAEQADFNACRQSQRLAQKAVAFNTCSTPLSLCDGDQLPVLPWGAGNDLTTFPDPPRNPEYDPFGLPSPWVNPWLGGTNLGCLQSGEQNTIWLRISVTTPGDLEWAFFFPEEDAFFNFLYMDWAVYPLTSSICTDIAANNPLSAPLRCNWNDWPASPLAVTGMATDSISIPIQGETDNFELSLPAVAGDEFLLLLDNFSGGTFNGLFDFSLSANSAGVCTTVLPANHTELVAEQVPGGVALQWLHTSSLVPVRVEMQRANSEGQFEDWKSISQADFMAQGTIEDLAPLPGKSFYRLRKTSANGGISFSNLAEVESQTKGLGLSPNPSAGQVQLLTGFPIYSARIFDACGKLVFQHRAETPTENRLSVVHGLRPGVYTVEAVASNGAVSRQKMVVQ